jgi:cation:H+ antiporter
LPVVLACAVTLPGLAVRLGAVEALNPVRAFLFGVAIVGGAFLLSWAAEVVQLDVSQGLALALLAATIYAFVLPFKGDLSLVDCAVLAVIFAVYVWRLTRLPAEEPHLVGPAKTIGALSAGQRRLATAALALTAAAIVLLVAKPFARALVATGTDLGVDEFLLVQWLAPLASEAPEFVVVAIFAWRAAGEAALGTVVSSKVNQWTLLVGMLPLVYAIALGAAEPLPLDARQEEEILLTAAQSLFAVALLLDRRLSLGGAGLLFALFGVQFAWPEIRVELSVVYIVLAAAALLLSRAHLGATFRGAWSAGTHE